MSGAFGSEKGNRLEGFLSRVEWSWVKRGRVVKYMYNEVDKDPSDSDLESESEMELWVYEIWESGVRN